jgi:hypothetical protein
MNVSQSKANGNTWGRATSWGRTTSWGRRPFTTWGR